MSDRDDADEGVADRLRVDIPPDVATWSSPLMACNIGTKQFY